MGGVHKRNFPRRGTLGAVRYLPSHQPAVRPARTSRMEDGSALSEYGRRSRNPFLLESDSFRSCEALQVRVPGRTISAMSELAVWRLDCTLPLRNNAIRAINNYKRVQRT